MSIIITNLGEKYRSDDGSYSYAIRINNNDPVAFFWHRREDGLAVCLEKAARAVHTMDEVSNNSRNVTENVTLSKSVLRRLEYQRGKKNE